MESLHGTANAELDALVAQADAAVAPSEKLPPSEWVRANLFNSLLNSIITVVVGALLVLAAWRAIDWAIAKDFEIVRASLRLMMVGQFPRDELWRLWASGLLIVSAIGFLSGALARTGYHNALDKGLPADRPTWLGLVRRFWAIGVVVLFFVSFARTPGPYVGVAAAFALLVASRAAGWGAGPGLRRRAVFIAIALVLASMVVLAGTGVGTPVLTLRAGLGRLAFGLLAAVWVATELGRRDRRGGLVDIAVRWATPVLVGAVVYGAVAAIPFEGHGWDEWGGLHLTLFVTVIGVSLGMPFGIVLALGRRSQLPVIKGASVLFIEFVRGVPLISLLLFSNLMLLLFFPLESTIPGDLTLAMIVITGFSAAYIAEIVRGGLQSVPKGQTEAAQASGLSAAAIQRYIVLPQALRNVIPAMVGQFIALFKDTTLLGIIGILEFLKAAEVANAQTDFFGKKLAVVTYTFVAIGYWAVAYTMSKESRRLETKLGVGTR